MSTSYQRQPPSASPNRVLTLRQWAELNSLGYRTAQRIIASGNGPKIVQLGDRRTALPKLTIANGRPAASETADDWP